MLEPSTIAELALKYELEPSIKDIFVEGPRDRVLIDIALRKLGHHSLIRAYEIAQVIVPEEVLASRSLTPGRKSQVIALAQELESRSGPQLPSQVVCLIDSDLDDFLGIKGVGTLIVRTKAMSLDVFLTREPTIAKLLERVFLGFPMSAAQLLAELRPVLRRRLVHRIVCRRMSIFVAAPPLTKSCAFSAPLLTFNEDEFLTRLLNKADAAAQTAAFRTEVLNCVASVVLDDNLHVNMEDFFELLHFCTRKVKPKAISDIDTLRRHVFALADEQEVAGLPEVTECVSRLS